MQVLAVHSSLTVTEPYIRGRERTNKMQLIRCLLSNFLSQHVSGIIMPIIRRIRPCPTACCVLSGCVGCGWLWSCGAASCTTHGLILLMMGIMMPETCWDRKFDNKHGISCILLVPSLHLMFTMHGHKNLRTILIHTNPQFHRFIQAHTHKTQVTSKLKASLKRPAKLSSLNVCTKSYTLPLSFFYQITTTHV